MIVADGAADDIRTGPAVGAIVAGAAEHLVVALVAVDPVVAFAAVDQIVALAPVETVVAVAAPDLVVAAFGLDAVVAAATINVLGSVDAGIRCASALVGEDDVDGEQVELRGCRRHVVAIAHLEVERDLGLVIRIRREDPPPRHPRPGCRT